MRILGVDPGLAKLGWGVVEKVNNKLAPVAYNCIRTSSKNEMSFRLEQIFNELTEVIKHYQPVALSVEKLFFHKNVTSALVVGQARGVVLLTARIGGLEVFEYTPLEIKQALVGYGRAEKQQVQNMVRVLLSLKEVPRPVDAADALGAAICHSQQAKLLSLINKR